MLRDEPGARLSTGEHSTRISVRGATLPAENATGVVRVCAQVKAVRHPELGVDIGVEVRSTVAEPYFTGLTGT